VRYSQWGRLACGLLGCATTFLAVRLQYQIPVDYNLDIHFLRNLKSHTITAEILLENLKGVGHLKKKKEVALKTKVGE
jgi:hypothetical protein